MKQNKIIIFFLILLLGIFFRFYNINWDQNAHLHPDERFLTMVGNAMQMPKDFIEYLDPTISKLNPANIGFPFFVYGILPVTLNKFLTVIFNNDSYNNFTLQGRILSVFADIFVIFFIFKTLELFEKKYQFDVKIKFFASFLYAISVLPIQLSHFFAVDTFLNLFMFISFYFAVRYSIYRTIQNIFFCAIFFGLALSAKISAIFISPLLVFLLIFPIFQEKKIKQTMLFLLLFGIVFYIVVRIANPYVFANSNFLNPSLDPTFVQNLETLKSWENKDVWFPPSVQWYTKQPFIFSLTNLALFGIGLPYFFFLLLGIFLLFRKNIPLISVMVFWTLVFFLYQSTQFVKAMRYFIFLYPYFAIIAAFGLSSVFKKCVVWQRVVILLFLFVWPLAFFGIYTRPHVRVEASYWIYKNVEDNRFILNEHWDDPLPLILENQSKHFEIELLPVFDPDTNEKWNKMNQLLENGDYLVLSSNRGWGSIPTVPSRYPKMTQFYNDLFSGKLKYKKIKEFTSYPSFKYLGIPIEIPDDFADESFTVYDHPKVIIFKKE